MTTSRSAVMASAALVVLLLSSCIVQPIQPAEEAPPGATVPAPAETPAGGTVPAPAEVAAAPEGALVSVPAAEAPALDGSGDDAAWAAAAPIEIEVSRGANASDTVVNLKSVYSGDMVYFLATWADPTQSFVRSPWVKQDDGSWAKLTDPDDEGGDNNLYYEDKLAMIWNINNSIPEFESDGCFTACHRADEGDPKPYGNKYTEAEGQMGDIWHWKSVRNLNQIDDQYLDHTPYSPETPEAGRHSDPKDSGGYVDNQTEDGTMPAFMGPEGYPRDGSPGYILDSEKVEFDDSLFAPGDMVPGIIKSEITGDRGNIAAGWTYADGMWTLEFARPLETGSEFDVQFSDLAAPYHFGVAIFDNAQVRHAFHNDAQTLIFQE